METNLTKIFPKQSKPSRRYPPKVAAPKGSRGRPQTSSVSIAPLSPPQRRNPLLAEKTSYGRKSCSVVAPICRDNVQAAGRAAWGRSCGSAKLVAGTLRCLRLCWGLPWSWSSVKQLGRCPKPHKGAPPLDPARGNPLDYHIKCNTAPKKERHCVRFVLE